MPAINDRVVIGSKEVGEALQKLGKRLASNVTKRALRSGAAVMRDLARVKAPVRTGALAKSIIAQADRDLQGNFEMLVTISKKKYMINAKGKLVGDKTGYNRPANIQRVWPRYYAHLVEFGTRPHAIGAKSRLSHTVEGKKRTVKNAGLQHGLQHPGASKKPFLRPAYDEGKLEAIKAIADRFAKDIPAETKAAQVKPPKGPKS